MTLTRRTNNNRGLYRIIPVRFTEQDILRSDLVAKDLNKPRSVLIREVWQQFLEERLDSKIV